MHGMLDFLKVAIVAYVFILLTEEGMIFGWYGRLIQKMKQDWLYKPLGGCMACFSGQCALWYYLIANFHSYNFFDHIVFISAVILTVLFIDKLINYGT
jgi:hypothetical protein